MNFFIKGTIVNGWEEETMVYLRVEKKIVGEHGNIHQNSPCNVPIGVDNTSNDMPALSRI